MFKLYNKFNSEKKRNFLAVIFGIIFWISSWSISEKKSGYRRGDLFRDISEHLLEKFFSFFKMWDKYNFLFIILMNLFTVFLFIFYLWFLIYLSFSLADVIINWKIINKENVNRIGEIEKSKVCREIIDDSESIKEIEKISNYKKAEKWVNDSL